MATEDKSIKRRRGTEAALKSTGQLIDGQAGFCSDKKKILFKRPATWTRPRTVQIIATAVNIYGSFKVEQIGAGYVFGIASTKF